MRFLVLKSKLFDKEEILNEKWIAIIVASIAGSFSTSAYTSYYINNTDKIGVQPGGANLGLDGPKKYKSKAKLIKKYAPYKNDVDQILQGLEYNKAQMKQISKKLNKQAEEETNK